MAAKNKWFIKKAVNAVTSSGYKGLKTVAEIILDEAQKITPLDTGELETSGRIDGDYKTLTVYISFEKFVNGEDIAIIQHENLLYKHAPGKEAKYLEKPFNYYGPALLESVIGEEIEKALK